MQAWKMSTLNNYFPLSANLIELLILAMVDRQDAYGYEISQHVKTVSPIKESILYPILKRLVEAKYVTTYTQLFQNRQRKYYQITLLGHNHLLNLKKQWSDYSRAVDRILEGKS